MSDEFFALLTSKVFIVVGVIDENLTNGLGLSLFSFAYLVDHGLLTESVIHEGTRIARRRAIMSEPQTQN